MANPWEKYSGPVTIGTPDPTQGSDVTIKGNQASASKYEEPAAAVALDNDRRKPGDRAFDEATKLRNEFQGLPSTVAYNVALGTYSSSKKTAKNSQGDQSLITSYAKMLDPTSSVREGEFTTTANTQKFIDQIKAKFAKEFGGEGGGMLTEQGRAAIRSEMQNLVIERFKRPYDRDRIQYSKFAEINDLDPYMVIGESALSQFPDDLLDPPKVPGEGNSALSPEQQRIYDATMAANPNATADQLNAIFAAANFPEVENLADIIEARRKGAGVMPGSSAISGDPTQPAPGYQESQFGQGMAGVNEGIAGTLGFPVDAATWVMNLVPKGLNAAANTDIPEIENPFMGSEFISNQLQRAGAIYPENADGTGGFSRRVGQSVGGAVIPAGAMARTGGQLVSAMLSATGGGIGGASAQKIFPDNQWAELAGEVVGGGASAGGILGRTRARAQAGIEAKVPTVSQLKEQAGGLYQNAEQRGVTASPQQTQQYADDMASMMRDEGQLGPSGRISDADTNATKAFNLVKQYAGQPMRPKEMETIRRVISDGRKSTDASDLRITKKLLEQHDDFAGPLAPEFGQARDVSSRYLQAEDLEQARDLAGARAGQFSGSGFENALRTEYRGLDRNSIKGKNFFNDDVMESVEKVSRGTPLSNTARNLGRFAPTGPVSTSLATGTAAGFGALTGGAPGAVALGSLAAGTGITGRALATKMGLRNAEIAELTARNGGRLPQAQFFDPGQIAAMSGASSGQLAQYLQENGNGAYTQYNDGPIDPEFLARRKRGGLFGAPR